MSHQVQVVAEKRRVRNSKSIMGHMLNIIIITDLERAVTITITLTCECTFNGQVNILIQLPLIPPSRSSLNDYDTV